MGLTVGRLGWVPCAGLLLLAQGGWAQADTPVAARLKAEFKATYTYSPPATVEENPVGDGEPILELEPMVITRPLSEVDIMEAARRAAEAREAKKFSALKGGTLLSFRRGDLGFWPQIVPVDATPVKKAEVLLVIDLLRIKW